MKTCPNCVNRIKADAHWDSNGGDFWHCTAKAIVPEFANSLYSREIDPKPTDVTRLINLNLFKEPDPKAPGLNAQSCPLFSPREDSNHDKA